MQDRSRGSSGDGCDQGQPETQATGAWDAQTVSRPLWVFVGHKSSPEDGGWGAGLLERRTSSPWKK